ncbi:ABC transporter substrate-binding protein [Roseomonas alkaliterrae]|uniref:Peptide/nickel transport system substrate-binding protein n=1 Tax=Neoroseomonas alkaliterrae TaxID=1452450 RepID=A0A840XRD0_9PROT|nr:ABC transporter substrate-binding protein [Neoroseomonas alkaliterrae]MBB5691115.1 peptide/nickel transport system substrate-binding protein [Neoroseomonas alkaliterrae]MBR0676085.1 ABC transporter substrate-binding protein [Neoroseomonas alkaliterrae]
MRASIKAILAAAAAIIPAVAAVAPASAQHLRIGLREDPDILDPTLSRTYVGRIVYMALCDKLFDINERLEIVPQLATGFRWESPTQLLITLRENVRFHDGEVMDAEAVRYSLDRHLNMQGSFRRSEIADMERVEVVDPRTVRIVLKGPSASFLSALTDRAGMIVSPRAAEAAGRNFGTRPVCAGPFRFVERVAQERIVVERFREYWDAANIHFDRVTYLPIPDNTVRLANLQSGAVEFVERMEPDDMRTIQRNRNLRAVAVDELGYQSITINIANGERANNPLGRDARVRQAFELAIDRAALNQVVYQGMYTPTRQPWPPANPFHVRDFPPTQRNVERARALLREAGVTTPVQVELTVPNNPDLRQVGEVIQAMVNEAGFNLTLRAMEFASSLQAAQRGDFQTYLVGWSGRTDPDGNFFTFTRTGGGQNDGRYSNPEVDRLLDAARTELDLEKRKDLYAQALRIAMGQDVARIYLWHRKNIMAHSARLTGYRPVSDGMIRLQGMRLQ